MYRARFVTLLARNARTRPQIQPLAFNLEVTKCSSHYHYRPAQVEWKYLGHSFYSTEAEPEKNQTEKDESSKKPSSKIEVTVNTLKQRVKSEEAEKQAAGPKLPLQNEETSVAEIPAKKPLMTRIVDEIKHYYSGFRLLFLDVRICSKIIWKVLKGNTLSRRENKQLVRTVGDLFRLVPFSVFILVPFMEFLLPVALKLFPGMLPSTFTTTSEREAKMHRALKAKLNYAKFLQKTLDEMSVSSSESDRSSKSASDFVTFYKAVKADEIQVNNADIIKFSQLFEDEITLDNMERGQLIALCRLIELPPIGTNNILRFQLEMKLRQLRIDDKVIRREGVDNMNVHELQLACKERGMRAFGTSEKQLKHQLEQWLELSIDSNIPPSLMLLSRTLYLPEELHPTAKIAATIQSLPESAMAQASTQIGEREGKIRNVNRLELIREEQRKIEEEEKEKTETETKEEPEVAEPSPSVEETEKVIDMKEIEELVDKAPNLNEKKETEISSQDLTDLKSAIVSLGKGESSADEEISGLKKELQDYEEDLEDLKVIQAEAVGIDLQESKGARRLFSKVNTMLDNMGKIVDSLEAKEKALQEMDENTEEEIVTIHELIEAVNKLQKTPDSARIEHIAKVLEAMDEDADGIVKVDHVLKVVRLLGRENVNLTSKQMQEISEMLENEEMLEVEEDIKKVLIKSPPDEAILIEDVIDSAAKAEVLSRDDPEEHIKEMFQDGPPQKSAMSCDHDKKKNGKTDLK